MKHTADSNAPSMRPRRSATIWSRLLRYGVPPVITIGLCYLLFTGVDMHEMARIIRTECRFGYIALALVISIFSHVFRAMRWRIQLNALGIRTPLGIIILSIFGTYAVNLVFPRLGEVWRSGYVAQRQNAPFTAVFGSMVAERLADTITVGLITLLSFVLASGAITTYLSDNVETFRSIRQIILSPWLWGAAAIGVIALWWLLSHKSNNRTVNKIQRAFKELWQGFAVIAKMPGKGQWLLWTACLWGCYYTQLLICFLAFPSSAAVLHDFGLTAALVVFALTSISMGVPSNGGIGPWQWAVIFALSIYGVDSANSGALANVVLGSNTLLQIVLGIFTFIMIAADRRRNKAAKTVIPNVSNNQNNKIKNG